MPWDARIKQVKRWPGIVDVTVLYRDDARRSVVEQTIRLSTPEPTAELKRRVRREVERLNALEDFAPSLGPIDITKPPPEENRPPPPPTQEELDRREFVRLHKLYLASRAALDLGYMSVTDAAPIRQAAIDAWKPEYLPLLV